jgi:hypothetical protein
MDNRGQRSTASGTSQFDNFLEDVHCGVARTR